MRTRFVSASWTIAALSSGGIAERDPELPELVAEPLEPDWILVEDRREQRRLRDVERVRHVTRRPGSARCDHGKRDSIGNGARELEAVPRPRTVGVDSGEQDLARSERLGLARPFDRAPAGGRGAGAGADLPARGVDGDDDRLRSDSRRELADELRPLERGAVHRHLVRTGRE